MLDSNDDDVGSLPPASESPERQSLKLIMKRSEERKSLQSYRKGDMERQSIDDYEESCNLDDDTVPMEFNKIQDNT